MASQTRTLASLAAVELQSIARFLPWRDILALARCSRQCWSAADSPFAWAITKAADERPTVSFNIKHSSLSSVVPPLRVINAPPALLRHLGYRMTLHAPSIPQSGDGAVWPAAISPSDCDLFRSVCAQFDPVIELIIPEARGHCPLIPQSLLLFPQLRSLSLQTVADTTAPVDPALFDEIASLPCLTRLHLQVHVKDADVERWAALSGCAALTDLTVRDFDCRPGDSVLRFITHSPIRRLVLQTCGPHEDLFPAFCAGIASSTLQSLTLRQFAIGRAAYEYEPEQPAPPDIAGYVAAFGALHALRFLRVELPLDETADMLDALACAAQDHSLSPSLRTIEMAPTADSFLRDDAAVSILDNVQLLLNASDRLSAQLEVCLWDVSGGWRHFFTERVMSLLKDMGSLNHPRFRLI